MGWNIEEKPEPRISDVSPEKAVGSSDTKESPTDDDDTSDDPDVCANLGVSPVPETNSDFQCRACQPPRTFSSAIEATEHMNVTDHLDIDVITTQ